jgi:hypothetical protein
MTTSPLAEHGEVGEHEVHDRDHDVMTGDRVERLLRELAPAPT